MSDPQESSIAASSIRNYSSTIIPSKSNIPIKSPSPDKPRINGLTPTKVKYILEGKSIRNSENIPTHFYQQGLVQSWSIGSTPHKIGDENKNMKGEVYQQMSQHIRELEEKNQVLSIQNKNLLKRLTKLQASSIHGLASNFSSSDQKSVSSSNLNISGVSMGPRRHSSQQIIQKIKEQYEQKIKTLRLMVEQQIRQAMSIIEDMCELMKDKLLLLQNRMQDVEQKVGQVKLRKILQIQQRFKEQLTFTDRLSKSKKMKWQGAENSISDILCVSIPQQQQEESKTQTIIISLEQQIQQLKQTIKQAQNHYQREKQQLLQTVQQKNREIIRLLHQKGEIERELQHQQQKFRLKNRSQNFIFETDIKEELIMLRKYTDDLVNQMQKNDEEIKELIITLENKNLESQVLTSQVKILHNKIHDSEKQRLLQEEKIIYLEGNVKLLEQEINRYRQQLTEKLEKRYQQGIKKVAKMGTIEFKKDKTTQNLSNILSHIQRMLLKQKERERVKQQIYSSTYKRQNDFEKFKEVNRKSLTYPSLSSNIASSEEISFEQQSQTIQQK